MMAGAFLLVSISAPQRVFRVSLLNCLVGFLLLCLLVFAIRGEPQFATPFSERLYHRLEASNPAGFIALPWAQRSVFIASCLLGLLAVSRLAASETFRRSLLATIGVSGLAVAVYSLAQRFLGLPLVPWALIEGTPEWFNASFFHYSATAACINLAWPLIVFGPPPKWIGDKNGKRLIFQTVILSLVLAALIPLGSAAGLAVALGLAAVGFGWPWLFRHGLTIRRNLIAAVGGTFLVIGIWQGIEVWKVMKQFPDGWKGSAQTIQGAEMRDGRLEGLSRQRGDAIIPSDSPVRPTLWLAGLRMAADYPLLGRGPGTWANLSATYSNDPLVNTFFHARQFIHNDPLQTAAEWGWVALLGWGGLLLLAGAGSIFPIRFDLSFDGMAWAGVGVLIHSTVDFPLQCPGIQLWLVLLLGLACSSKNYGT